MRVSRDDVSSATHAIPKVRFAEHELSSFGGLVIFQALIQGLDLRRRLRGCTRHIRRIGAYSAGNVLLLLVTHLFLGWRRLRDLDYYREDPLVLRVVGLKRLPSVATLSRAMRSFDETAVCGIREVVRDLVAPRACAASPSRLTFDVDGSVQSTKARRIEGTAIGYNKKRKGARSYYPLFVTIAQTGQVFDVLHRPGNCHDSRGACEFLLDCVADVRGRGFTGQVEVRLDSAHYSDDTCMALLRAGIEFSISVPFERLPKLKAVIENRRKWRDLGGGWSAFDWMLRPKRDSAQAFRCVVYRHKVPIPRQGPLQLDLFEPVDSEYEFKVVITNKSIGPRSLLEFHNGRGSQEAIFAELKSQAAMEYLPSRRLIGNQVFLQSAILAHTLARELQMRAAPPRHSVNTPTRACLWFIEKLGTIRKRVIQRAARLTRPGRRLVVTLAKNGIVEHDFEHLLRPWRRAA